MTTCQIDRYIDIDFNSDIYIYLDSDIDIDGDVASIIDSDIDIDSKIDNLFIIIHSILASFIGFHNYLALLLMMKGGWPKRCPVRMKLYAVISKYGRFRWIPYDLLFGNIDV